MARISSTSQFRLYCSAISIFVALLNVQRAVAWETKKTIGRSSVVQIKFVRSGGIAGNMTRVEGLVDLKDNNPSVHSAGTSYARALTTVEADHLRCIADPKSKCADSASDVHAAPIPDGRTYDVSITMQNGNVRSFTFQPEKGGKQGLSPELMSWIQQETDAIWNYRLSQRSAADASSTPDRK
jgi:hypothetical protein